MLSIITIGEQMTLISELRKHWVSIFLAYLGFIIFGAVLELLNGTLDFATAVFTFLVITGIIIIAILFIWLVDIFVYFVKFLSNPKEEIRKLLLDLSETPPPKRFKSGDFKGGSTVTPEILNEIFYRIEQLEKKKKND